MIDQNLERGKMSSQLASNQMSRGARRGQNLLQSSQNLRTAGAAANNQYNGPQTERGNGQGGMNPEQDFATEYSKKFNRGEPRKPLRNYMQVSQSTDVGGPQWKRQPRNDYEFIKGKNGHHAGNFNIISNKLKNF